jgi:hypothetical protein
MARELGNEGAVAFCLRAFCPTRWGDPRTEEGAAKATFTAKEHERPDAGAPLTTSVKVRLLRKDASVCWDATYSSPLTNDGTQLANSE